MLLVLGRSTSGASNEYPIKYVFVKKKTNNLIGSCVKYLVVLFLNNSPSHVIPIAAQKSLGIKILSTGAEFLQIIFSRVCRTCRFQS